MHSMSDSESSSVASISAFDVSYNVMLSPYNTSGDDSDDSEGDGSESASSLSLERSYLGRSTPTGRPEDPETDSSSDDDDGDDDDVPDLSWVE